MLACVASFGTAHAQIPEDVQVGVLLPLTGKLTALGEHLQSAVNLAGIDLNEYLEAGGHRWRVSLLIEDTGASPVIALDKIQVLHARGADIVVGPVTSASVSSIISYANDNNMTVISPVSSSPALAIPGDSVFRLVPDDRNQGMAIAAMLEAEGMEALIPIWRGDTYGDGLMNATAHDFESRGGISYEGIRYNPEAAEFSASVSSLADAVSEAVKTHGAERVAVLVISFEEVVSLLQTASYHEVLYTVKWFGSQSVAQSTPVTSDRIALGFAQNTGLTSLQLWQAPGVRAESVKDRLTEELGATPNTYVYNVYDAMLLAGMAILNSSSAHPADIRASIGDVAESGIGGTLSSTTLNAAGDLILANYRIWSVSNGSWVPGAIYHGGDDASNWKVYMLDLINAERTRAGLDHVELGPNPAAQAHADDMLENCYLSHWGLDGLKPHMRHSLAGGYHYNKENVSGLNYCVKPGDGFAAKPIRQALQDSMEGLMSSPGHRDTILDPHHKAVNIGLAWDEYNAAVAQQFEYGYVSFAQPPIITDGILSFEGAAKRGAGFASDRDLGVQIYYDPPPHPLERGQVARTECYDSGALAAVIRPPPPPRHYYPSDSFVYSSFEACPDPYDVPADTPAPASYSEAHQIDGQTSHTPTQSTYSVPRYDAQTWSASGDSFAVSADISEMLQHRGDGVYTVILWGVVDDGDVPMAKVSLFHNLAGQAGTAE